mgnify:FL=1
MMLATPMVSAQSQDTVTSSHEVDEEVINEENFKLYPTQNTFTFLKLDTRDGTILQVQWSHKEANRFETFLNGFPLVSEEEKRPNRFVLYPTQNIWTFVLLDQINGNTWQVQWSTDYNDRLILPISN